MFDLHRSQHQQTFITATSSSTIEFCLLDSLVACVWILVFRGVCAQTEQSLSWLRGLYEIWATATETTVSAKTQTTDKSPTTHAAIIASNDPCDTANAFYLLADATDKPQNAFHAALTSVHSDFAIVPPSDATCVATPGRIGVDGCCFRHSSIIAT